jgi:hypothetical protein
MLNVATRTRYSCPVDEAEDLMVVEEAEERGRLETTGSYGFETGLV